MVLCIDICEQTKHLKGMDYMCEKNTSTLGKEMTELSPIKEKKELTMGDKYEIIGNLIYQLSDSIGFMETLSEEPSWIGCVCEAEDIESENCTCIDKDGNIARITNKVKALEHAGFLLKQMQTEYKKAYEDKSSNVFDDSYRVCSECGDIMIEGYCIDGGDAYYCNTDCLEKNMTQE